MKTARRAPGFTLVELLAVVLAVGLLLAALLPSIARAQGTSGIQQSMDNLSLMGFAHVLYAGDWAGRQVTWTPDDLGEYESILDYPAYQYPPKIAGYGPNQAGDWVIWAYWPTQSNRFMLVPFIFPGSPNCSSEICYGLGAFRIPHSRPLHEYLSGRYHDPVFYAPNDQVVFDSVAPCLDEPPEFVSSVPTCNPGYSSYCSSPAAMFHPDVMRSNAAGGWQAPWDLPYGYESPGLFQATYPALKTQMIEHSWVQDPPSDCNPVYGECEPYWFNQGIGSSPVTLFYDGSVRLLPNTEVLEADAQVLQQTGGVDGLWHRGTPFGIDGYFIDLGYDGAPLSHHVLTTDGILGRDTVDGGSPRPLSIGAGAPRPAAGDESPAFMHAPRPVNHMPFTPEDDQP